MVNKIRQISETDSRKITKIAVFDFDGTIADTPTPDIGKVVYKEKTGLDWPHKGWWGRKETLDMQVFDIPVIEDTIKAYNVEASNPDTLVVMLTGRIPRLSTSVEAILNKYGLKFDGYYYNDSNSTLDFKINILEKLLVEFPSVTSISMWDDRDEHIEPFKVWGKTKPIQFEITHVNSNHHKPQ